MCLPAAVRGIKIGLRYEPVNSFPGARYLLTLAIAVVCIVAWIVLTFFSPVTSGAIHLLLAVGATLLVRWYALLDQRRMP
jgi:hypothetical protein